MGAVSPSRLAPRNYRGEAEIAATELFEQRLARATLLAEKSDAVREPLEFAAELSKAQAKCAARIQSLSGRFAEDVDALLPIVRPMMEIVAAVSDDAQNRLADAPETAKTRLRVYWSGDSNDYISRAILQPYASALRDRKINPDRVHSPGHCPFCGGAAWISFRKTGPDADVGFRYLGCSLCGLEWNFGRISCPACGEEDPHKLPNYRTDAHPNVRIETCEMCRRYVKSIDMTLDARPIPPVDDLLSLSMDLWAIDEGFVRIEPGMAGL
jgi:formate dehydrogenase maturation protein FdhE